MSLFGDDPDREQFFEVARQEAQRQYEADNSNVKALVQWGGALLELAHYKQGDESAETIKEAIAKLQKAISLDSDRTDAYWCLGNAYTSLGFLCPNKAEANQSFKEATKAFKHCYEKEPSNETYKKALEMTAKAPEYYDEIQTHIAQSGGGDHSGGSGPKKGGVSTSVPEWVWDVGGWVLLAAAVTGALLIAKASAPKVAAAATGSS
ncbi:hypothetical protein Vretimale_8606 [Volvox reticuliferus]|uniref:Mitochondrial import receptor subunit TOM20 n=1 Tax=Volvox reticuliferus TaxID=1737510 RepID=A0A8J4GB49_9CHLO|nr:hypothetical protein Vretifemale_6475 [Volvox reticuliferus]GIM03962.1 hypothetical protein Vretimale_8606 [Volvox reticuliferus]